MAVPGAVAVVLLAAIGLDRDAWLDEAFSVAATVQLRETFVNTWYTMAAYYAQLALWAEVSDALAWLRLLSVLHAVAAVLVLGVLVRRTHGRRIAFWATLFLGTSWMMVRYAHELRSFAFVALLVTVSWLAVDHLVEDPGRRRWAVVLLVIGVLAPLSHGMAVLSLGAQPVAVAAARADRRTWFAALPGWLVAVAVTAYLYRLGGAELGATAGRRSTVDTVELVLRQFHSGHHLAGWTVQPWWALVVLSAYGLVVSLRDASRRPAGLERFRALMAPAWGIGPIVVLLALSAVRPINVRYVIAAAVGLALLWAVAVVDLARRWARFRADRSASSRALSRVPVAALLVVALLLAGQYRYATSYPDDWSRLVEHVATGSAAGDAVAIPGDSRVAFDVAWSRLDDPPVLTTVAHSQPLGTVRRFDTAQSASDAHWAIAFAPRMWVVERSPGGRSDIYYEWFVDGYVTPRGLVEVSVERFGDERVHLFVNPEPLELVPPGG